MNPNRIFVFLLAASPGCDPAEGPTKPPPKVDAQAAPGSVEPAPAEPSAAEPAADAPPTPAVGAGQLAVTLADVRAVGDTIEIEVVLDRPISPGSFSRPSLQVGDEVTQRSRAGEGGRLDRLVFVVPADQYARMPVNAEILVRAGLVSNVDTPNKPRLSQLPLSGGTP